MFDSIASQLRGTANGLKKVLLVTGFVFAIGLSGLTEVAAAEVDDADEVIIVTAQKREQSLQETAISIKALQADTLETINADSLADITRLVPSMSMTDLSRGGNNVQLRGLGTNVGASVGTVAIYNDGVISAGRVPVSGSFAEQDSAIYDIERVEVLRGPQGTLYGEGSFGGVINIISARPNTSEFEASFSGTVFDVDEGSSDNTDLAGMINIPIADKVGIRLVGFKYDHDGYIDGVNVLPLFFGAPPEFLGEDLNTEEVTGGRISISFTPTDKFDATLIYKMQETEIGLQNYDSPDLITLTNTLAGTTFAPDFTQAGFSSTFGSENETDETILEINWDIGIGTLTSVTGLASIDIDNASGAVFENEAISEELRLSSNSEGNISWIVGAYFRSAEIDIEFMTSDFLEQEIDQWSVFGELYWSLTDTLTATFGLRFSDQDIDLTDQLNGLPTSSGSFDDISPKFALDWQLNDDTLLYGSVAKGFRAGGVNVDESVGTDATFESEFDPDEIWNYELGLKIGFFDNRVILNTAVFYIDWSDVQIDKAITSLISPPVQFIVVNGDDAHSTGIESDLYITLGDGWEIVLGGSFVEAEFDGGTIDSATAGLGVPLDGQRLPSSPEFLFNASIQKNFVFSNGWGAFGRVDWTVRGSSFGDVPNDPPPGGNFKSGRFDMLNLRAGVSKGPVEVQLFVNNATDEEGSSFNFFDGGFGDVHVLLPPRTVGVNLKLNFNH